MKRRAALISLGTMALTACAGIPSQATAPTPVIVTSEVTRVVVQTQIIQRTVVVTATPPAVTQEPSTPETTETTEATAEPTTESTPPVAVDEPVLTARLTREANVYALPDEENYNIRGTLPVGKEVLLLFRGGQWFQINSGETENSLTGWVYRDWIDLSPDKYDDIPFYPGPQVVLTGNVVQEFLAGSTLFKGRVFNIGDETATGVRVEVELFDGSDRRVDIADALTRPFDIGPQVQASFEVITNTDEFSTYIARTTWDV